jgi:hypothetical protein
LENLWIGVSNCLLGSLFFFLEFAAEAVRKVPRIAEVRLCPSFCFLCARCSFFQLWGAAWSAPLARYALDPSLFLSSSRSTPPLPLDGVGQKHEASWKDSRFYWNANGSLEAGSVASSWDRTASVRRSGTIFLDSDASLLLAVSDRTRNCSPGRCFVDPH